MYVHLYKSTFKSFKSFIVSLFCSVDFEHLSISVCLSFLFIYIVDGKFSLLLFLLIEGFFFFFCVCVCVCMYVCVFVRQSLNHSLILLFIFYLLHLCKQLSSLGKWFTFAPREPYIFSSTTALLKYPFYLGFSVLLHFHLFLHKPFNAFSSTYISCSI